MKSFSDKICSDFLRIEEQVIQNTLRQILEREPTFQDWEKLKCIYSTDKDGVLIHDKYYLEFEEKAIGMIKKQACCDEYNKFEYTPNQFKIEFIPCDVEVFLEELNDEEHAHRCYEFNIKPIAAHQNPYYKVKYEA